MRGVPKGPAIAVLPFANLSGDPKQEYFSDGLTEDILTELSRARDLRVLARNTSFQYKGQAVNVGELGRELGVRYVLEGSIQRTDDRLRVTAQLIDTETGTHVWADRFDREMADVFLVQDEIVSEIVAKIAGGYGVIESSEAKSAARKSAQEIQAYDLVLRARDLMRFDWRRANFRLAKELLRQAIALDPLNARALCETAWLAVLGRAFRFDETPVPPQEIIAQANKAVQLDPADARARIVAASAYFYNGQLDLFEQEAQAAVALDPYDADILATFGYMIAISGQWQRGVTLVTKANALNADAAAGWYHVTMYLDYYLHGDYKRALELIRQDPGRQSDYLYVGYIPIYGELGRKQEALENWRKLLADEGDWSAESFETWWRMRNMRDEDIAKLGRRLQVGRACGGGDARPVTRYECLLWVICGHWSLRQGCPLCPLKRTYRLAGPTSAKCHKRTCWFQTLAVMAMSKEWPSNVDAVRCPLAEFRQDALGETIAIRAGEGEGAMQRLAQLGIELLLEPATRA